MVPRHYNYNDDPTKGHSLVNPNDEDIEINLKALKTIENHKMPEKGGEISVTINLPDDEQSIDASTYAQRKKLVSNRYQKLLKNLKGFQAYVFYLEICSRGRLHIHGVILIDNPEELYHSLILMRYLETSVGIKVSGRQQRHIDIDTADATWYEYIQKDHKQMKTIFYDQKGIPSTNYYLKTFEPEWTYTQPEQVNLISDFFEQKI